MAVRAVPATAWSNDRARDLTRALYQGILMRDPDPAASGTTDAIRNGGYNALVDEAVNIANSRESRFDTHAGASISSSGWGRCTRACSASPPQQADPDTWRSDLRMLNDGQIARVVEGIVRSDRFRSRYGLTGY